MVIFDEIDTNVKAKELNNITTLAVAIGLLYIFQK